MYTSYIAIQCAQLRHREYLDQAARARRVRELAAPVMAARRAARADRLRRSWRAVSRQRVPAEA